MGLIDEDALYDECNAFAESELAVFMNRRFAYTGDESIINYSAGLDENDLVIFINEIRSNGRFLVVNKDTTETMKVITRAQIFGHIGKVIWESLPENMQKRIVHRLV
jgi:hypothetical protein